MKMIMSIYVDRYIDKDDEWQKYNNHDSVFCS